MDEPLENHNMDVCISIVNYNTEKLIKDCLQSIISRKWRNNIKIFVLDNASSDGSAKMLKEEFPRINLIENKTNAGFGAGHNIIFKNRKTDYFLVINSDTLIENNSIDDMVDFMEENKACGIASCKILGFDGKLQPNAGDLPFGISLISWLFNLETFRVKRSFHRNESSYYETAHEVGWVSGNFMMIRDTVFKKIGYFDEDYFMYFEDTDFCYRARRAGFKIMVNPKTYIKHLSGGSLDDPSLRQWTGEFKGLIHFYFKNFGFIAGVGMKLLSYLTIFLRIIVFAFSGKINISLTYGKVIASI